MGAMNTYSPDCCSLKIKKSRSFWAMVCVKVSIKLSADSPPAVNVMCFLDFKSGFGDSSSGRRCLLQCDRCRTGALQCRWLQVYIAAAGSAKLFLLLHYLILHGCVSPCLHFPVFFIALWNDNAICVFLYSECMEHQQCLLNVQWDSWYHFSFF